MTPITFSYLQLMNTDIENQHIIKKQIFSLFECHLELISRIKSYSVKRLGKLKFPQLLPVP